MRGIAKMWRVALTMWAMLSMLLLTKAYAAPDGGSDAETSTGNPFVVTGPGGARSISLPIENGDHPTILFGGLIFDESGKLLMVEAVSALMNPEIKELTILIESPGGSTDPALIAGAAIAEMRGTKKVRCVVLKNGVASSAFYLLQKACTERIMVSRANLITHKIVTRLTAGDFSAQMLIEMAKEQEEIQNQFDMVISKRLHLPLDVYKAKIAKKDWVMTPAEAIETGAIDKVVKKLSEVPNIPKNISDIEDSRP
jgi:ATP-dependent protease ClpP protease subunit